MIFGSVDKISSFPQYAQGFPQEYASYNAVKAGFPADFQQPVEKYMWIKSVSRRISVEVGARGVSRKEFIIRLRAYHRGIVPAEGARRDIKRNAVLFRPAFKRGS